MTQPTPERAAVDHSKAYWQLPSRSLTGGCLLLIGFGLLLYLWGRLGHPVVWDSVSVLWLVAVPAFAIGMAFLLEKPPVVAAPPIVAAPPVMQPQMPAPVAAAAPTTTLGNRDLDRIMQVVTSSNLPLRLLEGSVSFDEEQALQGFKLVAEKPGYFGDKRLATIVMNKLETIDGEWDFDVDPKRDTITGTRKTSFPKFVPPPHPETIAASVADAIAGYHKFKFRLGVNELNEPLEYSPAEYPHWMAIGGTGAGKSVFVRSVLEPYRAAGWAIFISDGKKTDYASLGSVPNVVMISADTAEHVRLMHAIVEEINRRAEIAQQRKIAGHPDPFAFVPWLVILDEFASVRRDIEGLYAGDPDKDSDYVSDFLYVLRKGREFRVHVAILTQDLYSKTIPGDARGNIKLIISLGAPEKMTLDKAFPKELQDRARRLGQRISAAGRGLVADPEAATVVEFQGYYGYTPGMNINDPKATEAMRAAWTDYRDNVSNKIRGLYSRQWFAIEEAEDLDKPIAGLNALKMVNLDRRDGTPNPQMLQYDKLHDSYNGMGHSANHDGALLEIDPEASRAGPTVEIAEPDDSPDPALLIDEEEENE
ncbi:type IV secretory system conjugative DNA transfer family protein [[Mycobacterium] crassicus]|uniref:Type IV secretory system conjugative DNA transfer family protein n=2 Tax=Mycolicibacter TaxID=1073531 RepID=A0ABU5XL97_9MYCO|nr:type IV secretory system conjugative DNA transfer family protein [Mycolicibacter sp. MYC098]MEB3022969.1 type IV secretory system conjugative DNA transfer family protein [Mycolicibacter sp. MYC098]